MAQYGIFFTQLGRDKIASATEGNPLDITHIAVGDGGGGYPEIDDEITSLVNELGRYPINGTSTPAPTQRQVSAVVPPEIGPAVIRERGLIDSDGDLIAIAQAEPIEMPAPGPNAVSVTVGILATFNNADYVRAMGDLQGFVRTTRKVIAGTGLTGGGALSDDVSIDADIATEGESRNSASDNKLMTPNKVFRAIDHWSPERAFGSYLARSFTEKDSLDSFNGFRGVTWSPKLGKFFAVNSVGTSSIFTSSNGENWSATSVTSIPLFDIIWVEGLEVLVAVGIDACITSPDGENWTVRNIGQGNWSSVTWSPELGLLVAVGTNSCITSPDGENWTVRNIGQGGWSSVTWSPELGLLVAVGNTGNSRIIKSSDGENWESVHSTNSLHSVDWSSELGIFIAVGNSIFLRSTDGEIWETVFVSDEINDVYTFVKWIPQLGMFFSASYYSLMTSFNGEEWFSSNKGFTNSVCSWSPELGRMVIIKQLGENKVHISP